MKQVVSLSRTRAQIPSLSDRRKGFDRWADGCLDLTGDLFDVFPGASSSAESCEFLLGLGEKLFTQG
jgi:hypothetical protein